MKELRWVRGINIACYVLAIVLIVQEFLYSNPTNDHMFTGLILLTLAGILLTGGISKFSAEKRMMGVLGVLLAIGLIAIVMSVYA
jgi:hypothetical protein